MDFLVAVASKHGATLEIGEAIAETLRADGLAAQAQPVEAVEGVDGFDAVVLGSGVYASRWMLTAQVFVDRFEPDLRRMPTWLFSSGPIGDPPRPGGDPMDVASISRRLAARGHRVFPGRLDPHDLSLPEKAVAKLVRAPAGDYRSWPSIAAWSHEIAATLLDPNANRA